MKKIVLTNNIRKIINLLNDSEFHSGTDIGLQLGLTRSGVWKLMQQLNTLGITIDSSTNKGYRLTQPLELLDKTKVKKNISTANLEKIARIYVIDDLASTNDFLVSEAKQKSGQNLVCMAEHQTAGRGRLGREWISPFAENIYLSLLWHFSFDISKLAGLNIVAGVAVAEAINQATEIQDIQLKWPNDIFWQNSKLGGILIDVVGEFNGHSSAVIGIGLNVNMTQANAQKINRNWTSLATAAEKNLSRNKISGILIDTLIHNLLDFEQHGIKRMTERWKNRDYLAGKAIEVRSTTTTLRGIAKGIDHQGCLLLKEEDGNIQTINSGDASILHNCRG